MKFLIDANLPNSSKLVLEKAEFEVEHVNELKLGNASDESIFQYAQQNGQIIITRDTDFADAIKFKPGHHYGIIVMRISYLANAQLINNILKEFVQNAPLNKIKRALVILETSRYRIRFK